MKLLFFSVLLWFCSSVSAKPRYDKPYLNEARRQSNSQAVVEKLSPYANDDGPGSGFGDLIPNSNSSNSDFQNVIARLRDAYMRRLDTLMFDNCCQPKFLGVDGLSTPIFPMRGGSSSRCYATCDMNTEGGGWMVILRRTKRRRNDFYWEYKKFVNGFGTLLKNDYWMGLLHMHHFTSQPGGTELRVELMRNGTKYVACYDDFFVDSENVHFTLRVGGYRKNKSNISDSFSHNSGFNFTTFDLDSFRPEVHQQLHQYTGYCTFLHGAWWHGTSGNETCTLFAPGRTSTYKLLQKEIVMHKFVNFLLSPRYYMWVVDGQKIGFDFIEMKIRPKTWECGAKGLAYTEQVIRLAFLSRLNPSFNPFNGS